MTTRDHWNSQLEAYLDGLLTGEQLQAFKQQLNVDASLQTALRQQRLINASLRRRFAPTSPDLAQIQAIVQSAGNNASRRDGGHAIHLNGSAKSGHDLAGTLIPADSSSQQTPAATPLPQRARFNVRRYALAAAIVLVLGGSWLAWSLINHSAAPSTPSTPVAKAPRKMDFTEYYHEKVDDGMDPAWLCKDMDEFASTFQNRLGQSLKLHDLTTSDGAAMKVVGIDYATCLTPDTLAVLVRAADNKEVVVLVDRAANDITPAPSVSAPLHLHRRELAGLVMYEITPLDQPHVLDAFFVPNE